MVYMLFSLFKKFSSDWHIYKWNQFLSVYDSSRSVYINYAQLKDRPIVSYLI